MTFATHVSPRAKHGANPWWRRVLRHPLAHMVAASLATFVPLALSFMLVEALLPREMRIAWPNLMATVACALGYWACAKWFERREVSELSVSGAPAEWARGAGMGALLVLLTLAPLGGLGIYRIEGMGDSLPLLRQIPAMLLVSVIEELLFRGVLFRIAEQAWGSRRALVLSTALFVAAHLPGDIDPMGVLVTAAASVAFAAAYLLSRRLWWPMGMHFAWNYLLSAVFSVPVSGHVANGWLHGSMSGPEWLSGGTYGVEASAVALLVWATAGALLLRRAHCAQHTAAAPMESVRKVRAQEAEKAASRGL